MSKELVNLPESVNSNEELELFMQENHYIKYKTQLVFKCEICQKEIRRNFNCFYIYGFSKICKNCRRMQTNEEKTGYKTPLFNPIISKKAHENIDYSIVAEKSIQTKIERYGTANPSYFIDFSKIDIKKRTESVIKTNMERYGVKAQAQRPEIVKKMVATRKKNNNYNCQHLQTEEVRSKARAALAKVRYTYNSIGFDSGWELAYYLYLTENNIDFEYQPKEYFTYIENGKEHKYFPDFKIGEQFYEIKGDQFFSETNEPINPYSHQSWKEKYDCLIKNGVTILRYSDLSEIIEKYHSIVSLCKSGVSENVGP